LPDFRTKNTKLGIFFEGLGIENVGTIYSRLVFVLPFGIFYGRWVRFGIIWYIFPLSGMLHQEKIWQPCTRCVNKLVFFMKRVLSNSLGCAGNYKTYNLT
jgi:hypothetical protein